MPNNNKKEQLEKLNKDIGISVRFDDIVEHIKQSLDEGTLSTPSVKKFLTDGISRYISQQ